MTERIVVCSRMSGEEVSRLGRTYLDRARALTQRAEAMGATLAAWSATMITVAFDVDSFEEAIDFVVESTAKDSPPWACGMARGTMEPLASKEGGGRADLAWGPPLVAAVMLARAAPPGEALVHDAMEGLADLATFGHRVSRDGEQRVRGLRLDVHGPWRPDATEATEAMKRTTRPVWVGAARVQALLARPGLLHVVRADPGRGGSRFLAEVAAACAGAPSLYLAPSGASVEPLGALRRAVTRALASRPYPEDAELRPVLDMFLGGIGANVEQAAAIIGALLKPAAGTTALGALFLDDAGEIDAESLEACAQIVSAMPSPFHCVVRIDATDAVPPAIAPVARGIEVELGPLDRVGGEALAAGVLGGAMEPRAARRFARRAANVPLGIVESIGFALATGELAWRGDRAVLPTRGAFAGKPRSAAYWIRRRAKTTTPDERGVLATVALFGGETTRDGLRGALALVQPSIAVEPVVDALLARRALLAVQPGWVALPSRSHRDTIAELLEEAPRRSLHRAISEVLEQSEGELGCAEAAHHAVHAGEGARGARLALRAARAAAAAGMSKSMNRLLSLARLADPSCEPLTRQQLLTSLPPPSIGPASVRGDVDRSAVVPPPPPAAVVPRAPASAPSQSALEEAPTNQLSTVSALEAAALVPPAQDTRDSDPTVVRLALAADDRATSVDPIGPVLSPAPDPPRPAPPRPADPTLPKPLPPLSLRPAPPPLPLGRPPQVPRPSAQMAAVRPPEAPRIAPRPPPLPPSRTSVSAMPAVPAPRANERPPSPPDEDITRTVPGVAPPPVHVSGRPPPLPAAARASSERKLEVARPAPLPTIAGAPTSADASDVGARMAELAKGALLDRDAAGVERWTEGLRAAGDHGRLAERIEAIARLTRGEVSEALRTLRAAREGEAPASPAARARASLALGLALAASNLPDDALLAGLDALARAREAGDDRAEGACLAFLAKLYARAERPNDAAALKAASKR